MDSGYKQEQYQHHYQDEQRHHHHHNHHHQETASGGLTRFRSAPSSYFATFLDSPNATNNERGDFSTTVRPLSPETEDIFASFMSTMPETNSSSSAQKLCNIPENSAVQQEYLVQVKQEREILQHYQSKPPLVNHKIYAMDIPFTSSSATTNPVPHNNLTRHSSSPAGFFNSILDIDNDYGMIKGMGSYGARNGQTNFSQGQPSSTSELISPNSDSKYMGGYSMKSWDDSILSESFSSLDRVGGDDASQTFSELNTSENQIGEKRNRLAHHLSLPSSSAMDRLLQFQDTVPLRIRAKRGCATHPRSIAERVRRTKISDRMRKLQDLVPSMDKQTNTADMLDLAVEYIKDLQKKVKNLNDNRTACTCPR